MGWIDDLLGKTVLRNGVVLPDRKKLNFIQGTGSAVTVADNPGTGATDVTINLTNAAVAGPGLSTDNAIARWDGTSGALLQNSGPTIDDNGALTVAASSGNAVTITTPTNGIGLLANASSAGSTSAALSNTAGRALTVTGDTSSPALAALRVTPQDAQPTGTNLIGDLYVSTAGVLWVCTAAGSPGTWQQVGAQGVADTDIRNLGLTTSVAANALTITLTQADGATVPSTGSGEVLAYTRGLTAATGDSVAARATSATTLVVPSTATLGTSNGVAMYLYVYAVNNSGVLELGVVGNTPLDEGTRQTSTAMSNAADNPGVLYTAVSRTQVGVKLIGRILITEATAGTWATNASEVTPMPFSSTMANLIGTQTNDNAAAGRPGEVGPQISRLRSSTQSLTTNVTANVTASSITLGPGDWDLRALVGFNTAGTTSVTAYQAGISKTTATMPAAATLCVPTAGEVSVLVAPPASVGSEFYIALPPVRVSIAVATTFFLVAQMTFTVSTASTYGSLEARRVR